MRPRLVDDATITDCLADLFRSGGYEGVSLGRIEQASGLKRSSLYHRFPRGKDQMAEIVIDHVVELFAANALAIADGGMSLADRVVEIGRRVSRFYGSGRFACLLDTMSIGPVPERVRAKVERAMAEWIDAFTALAVEAGLTNSTARERAVDAIGAIEGALVIARTTGDRSAFERAIRSLPERLATPPTGGPTARRNTRQEPR